MGVEVGEKRVGKRGSRRPEDGRLLHLQGSESGGVNESAYGSEKWMDFK